MSDTLKGLLIIASVLTVGWILRKIRKNKVKMEDAIFWIFFAAILLLLAIFPEISYELCRIFGIMSPSNLVFLVIIFLLVEKIFTLSIIVSQLEDKIGVLSAEVALRSKAENKNIDNVDEKETLLEREEVEKLEEVLPVIWDELSPEARAVIDKQGVVYTDSEGDLVTSIVNGKDCVFTCYDDKGYCYCAIEKAYREGRCNFYKPVSCHLYPIRVGDYGPYKAVNYHRWDVCKAAVLLGKKENVPVYKFLKEPLIRKFGEAWYAELENVAEELEKQHII